MNKSDLKRNYCMLDGRFAKKGYDWWWHNFTAVNTKTGEEKSFFIEYFTCNPALANTLSHAQPILGQLAENRAKGLRPSYVMVKCGWWGENATQLHRFFAWNEVNIGQDDNGYFLKAADCSASEKQICGSVDISEQEAAAG